MRATSTTLFPRAVRTCLWMVLALIPLGCATRQQLLEMETDFKARMTKMEAGLAAETARVDQLNTRLTAVSATATEATRLGTEATRIGTDAQQRADAAAAKGEAVDGRVTRALANRFSRTQVEEFKVLFEEGRVELSAAVRYDDYSDFGNTTNPRVGIVWSPLTGLDLRRPEDRLLCELVLLAERVEAASA